MKLAALVFVFSGLVAGHVWGQQALSGEGLILWLDFSRPQEGGFICSATGTVCEVTNSPSTQYDAALVSQFATIRVPDLAADAAVAELTLSAWVAPSKPPSSYQTILYKGKRQGSATQQIHFFLSLFDGRPEFKFKDEAGKWHGIMRNGERFSVPGGEAPIVSDVPAVNAQRWNHVAATFDRGQISLYLNGAEILSGRTTTDRLVTNRHALLIGEAQALSGPRSYLFDGLIDEVRIYQQALSEAEVRALYAYERAAKPTGALSIDMPLPEGYDPGFEKKLPLVAAYEAETPARRLSRGPVTAGVAPYRGACMLHINGQPVYGMAMMPEPYVSDDLVTLSCRDFAAAGVDLYSEILWSWMTPGQGCSGWWLGPGEYDFDRVDRRIRAIVSANPNALIFPRVKLNPPGWWLKEHPDEITRDGDGKPSQQVSLASRAWEDAYERMLRDMIRHMEASDYAGHIIGYHPAGGGSSEWFWWGDSGKIDYSPAAVRRFRQWLSDDYGGDVEALRRAWGDPQATFDAAQPPPLSLRQATPHGLFRDPVKGRWAIDYRRFLSAMVSHNITRSCRIVKEETDGDKLAGVFYGYSLYCLNTDGFQGLEEVLGCPDVDFLAAPTAYDRRRGGEAGSFISAYTASYRLHNKVYWDEVDTRTHLFPGHVSYRTESLPETLAVLRRAAGQSLSRGTSLWWFLLAGNATFHQAEVMEDVARLRDACEEALQADRESVADVAVFADERSMHLCAGNNDLRRALTRDALDELACMGAPYDLYLLPDIRNDRLPDYKLYVFLNAFIVDEDTREAIKARVRRGNAVAVWVYAPGYVTQDGFSQAGLSDLTGLSIRAGEEELPGELTLTGPDHPVTACLPPTTKASWTLSPSFTVDDPQATVLGTTAGRATLAVRQLDDWRSVYSMLPLSRELLQGLCRYAGAHVYSESFDTFYANAGYAMIHTATEGVKRIALPGKADVTELVSGKQLGEGIRVIEQDLPAGVTRIYRIDRREG